MSDARPETVPNRPHCHRASNARSGRHTTLQHVAKMQRWRDTTLMVRMFDKLFVCPKHESPLNCALAQQH